MTRFHKRRPTARITMKVLLLGATGTEPSFQAWQLGLHRAGVPFEAIALRAEGSRFSLLGIGGDPSFQALIFATDAPFDQELSDAARDDVAALEREFGLRRLTAYAFPGPAHGLQAPRWAGALRGISASLTPSGRQVFPYLRGPLPIDPTSWGYLAAPISGERFDTLVAAADGSALVGIYERRDGRQEMVQTFDSNAGQAQAHLLRRGQLAWLMRGRYLGHERNYLSLEIDDVLLPNHGWNAASHTLDRDPTAMIRMTSDDAAHAARWSRSRGLRLDLVCNGAGSERYAREAGIDADPLLCALLDRREEFGWINHTYEHLDLDDASAATIEGDIARNRSWADRVGVELESGALVTGEHTGLANLAAVPPRRENPQFAAALAAQGIRYLGCDASRPHPMCGQDPVGPSVAPGVPFAVGTALAVPRHPTLLAYAAATPAQALDQLRHLGLVDAPSWEDVLHREASRIFAKALSNDPCPHYFHQSNLAAGGSVDRPEVDGRVFYMLIDAVMALYRRYVKDDVPLVQPTLCETGELLSSWMAWRGALEAGSITGYIEGSRVTIVNLGKTAIGVPTSGLDFGSDYAGMRSGWTRVEPGETVLDQSGG